MGDPATALIVESRPDTGHEVAERLRTRGLETRIAWNGVTALQMMAEEAPDLVVMDAGLPRFCRRVVTRTISQSERFSEVGLVVLRRLRALDREPTKGAVDLERQVSRLA